MCFFKGNFKKVFRKAVLKLELRNCLNKKTEEERRRKEGKKERRRELAQFCSFILELIVSYQHALHIAVWRVHFEIKCYFMCF